MSESLSPDAIVASAPGTRTRAESYYGHPVLRKAHWRWEAETYLWVGGIAGGSAALATLADNIGDEADAALARTGRYVALAGAGASAFLLIKDLGRPTRFLNMLRIFKLSSPMSVGVWTLVWFSASATLAAVDQLKRDGLLKSDPFEVIPKIVRDGVLAGTGVIMGSYTGVLIAATAIPVWYEGRRHIPALFVASAVATACAANAALLAFTKSQETVRKLERLETLASLAELVLLYDYKRSIGRDAAPLFEGKTGRRLRTWTLLAGAAVPLALNLTAWFGSPRAEGSGNAVATRPFPLRTLLASALTLYGGLVLRQSVVEAGRRSADDPRPVLRSH